MSPIPLLIVLATPLFCFLVLGFLVFALDSVLRGHDLPTSRQARQRLAKILSEFVSGSQAFYDLGCGRGTTALFIKSRFPEFDVRGLDKSSVRIFCAKVKACLLGRKIKFIKEDILRADLRDADAVYVYVWYALMPQLEKKLREELKKGAVVITNTVHFPNWQPVRALVSDRPSIQLPDYETFFVYIQK